MYDRLYFFKRWVNAWSRRFLSYNLLIVIMWVSNFCMTEKNIKLIVTALGILIIIAFFLILYGMYTKISSNFLRKEINTENISLSLKKGDVIENFQTWSAGYNISQSSVSPEKRKVILGNNIYPS